METREIKFRCWDADEKIMHQSVGVHGNIIYANDEGTLLLSAREYPLMQFTGLKDKHGVEIYEDDVVKARNKYGSTKEKYPLYRIRFHDGSFYGVSIKKHRVSGKGLMWIFLNLDDYIEMETCEAIGNVYQSPELLARKKKEV